MHGGERLSPSKEFKCRHGRPGSLPPRSGGDSAEQLTAHTRVPQQAPPSVGWDGMRARETRYEGASPQEPLRRDSVGEGEGTRDEIIRRLASRAPASWRPSPPARSGGSASAVGGERGGKGVS